MVRGDFSMMLKVSIRRLLLGASVVCGMSMVLNAGAIQAEVLPNGALPVGDDSLILLPLEPMSMAVTADAPQLDVIADSMNTQMADARSQPEEPTGFSLEQLPIVGDLVDEKGNFDWGMDLPVSVNVGDVLGAYGVTVDMDFSL